MRLTCAVTVSAAGDILRPFIVFKGKHDGRIAREFGNPEKSGFPVDCSYMCQERAWMDEVVMLQWVKEVLEPWSKDVPPGIVPYLLTLGFLQMPSDVFSCSCHTGSRN